MRPTWRSYLSAWLEKVVLDASLGNKVNSHTVSYLSMVKCISTELGLWFRFGRWEYSYWQFLWWASEGPLSGHVHSPKPVFCVSHRFPWKGIQVKECTVIHPAQKMAAVACWTDTRNCHLMIPAFTQIHFSVTVLWNPTTSKPHTANPLAQQERQQRCLSLVPSGSGGKRDLSSGEESYKAINTDHIWKL